MASSIMNRRDLLLQTGAGFGSLALLDLLSREGYFARGAAPPVSRGTHHPAKAKHVVFLFMNGAPSHIDTFDPKPSLSKFDDTAYKGAIPVGSNGRPIGRLMRSPFPFTRHGKSGLEISSLFPHTAKFADDLCVLRGMYTDTAAHASGCLQMNTGGVQIGKPSLGSWLSYGLGSLNDSLPSYVVMTDPRGGPIAGASNWSAGYMAAKHQGTLFRGQGSPLLDLANPRGISDKTQRDSARTRAEYGLDDKRTGDFGRKCLITRRLLERGVRFIQLYSGGGHIEDTWDGHNDCIANHTLHAGETDRPIAALMADLKRTGLWKDTLLVWGGEFGRTPTSEGVGKRGRDHNPFGFSMWLAGAGVKGGQAIGATDELGFKAVKDRCHTSDLHATILHLMGIDHEKLTILHQGGDLRLTGVRGKVVEGVVA